MHNAAYVSAETQRYETKGRCYHHNKGSAVFLKTTTAQQFRHWIVEKMQIRKDEGKSTLKKKRTGDYTTTWNWRPDGWRMGSFILRSFFQAFYFCLRQTNKQNSPTMERHERCSLATSGIQSFYSYILHSTSTSCCIWNKKPSVLTFAAPSEHSSSLSSAAVFYQKLNSTPYRVDLH